MTDYRHDGSNPKMCNTDEHRGNYKYMHRRQILIHTIGESLATAIVAIVVAVITITCLGAR